MIELLIVLAIGGVLTAVAGPPVTNWIQNNQLHSSAQALAGVLKYARSEAIARNQFVTLETQDGNKIAVCVVAVAGEACDPDGDGFLKSVQVAGTEVTIEGNAAAADGVSFTPRGRLQEGGGAVTFGICDERGSGYGRHVEINQVGRSLTRKLDSSRGDGCNPA